MSDRPTEPPPPQRLTGAAQFIGVLRNLGLLHLGFEARATVGRVAADDGQQIPVFEYGRGQPVVLLHGLGCSHRNWSAVMRRLTPGHRVFAWDARGHGLCRPLTGDAVTLRRLARDVSNLIEYFGLQKVVLVGHSMGALTAMQFLNDHGTARISALCLVDQSPRVVTDDEWRLGLWGGCSAAMLTGLIEGARNDFAATVMREIDAAAGGRLTRFMGPDTFVGRRVHNWLRSMQVEPLLDLCASLVEADFRALLPRMNLPLMVVLGGRSAHYARVPLAGYYRQTVPGVEVHTYDGSGHSPHYAEPVRFAQDLIEFIAAVG